jgi:hypothetical protein
VTWSPTAPTAGDSITITVGGVTQPARLHWGVNGWQLPIAAYRPAGTTLHNGTGPAVQTPFNVVDGSLKVTLGPFDEAAQTVAALDFVLYYENGTWDNNGGADWHAPVTGGGGGGTVYVMDGALDASAELACSHAGVNLYLGWNGTELYAATQAAGGVSQDVFLFFAGARGDPWLAPWAKAGQVGAWSAYLANESSNNWCGWYDQSGAVDKAAGTVLEGTLNLAGEYGAVPASVFVAVGRYGTANGGTLQAQACAGNDDGNLDGSEYHEYVLAAADVTAEPAASGLRLLPVSPTPVRGDASVAFLLPREGDASLEVFDTRGRLVARLAEAFLPPGRHQARWNAAALESGVYFVRLRAAGESRTRRAVVIR